MQTHLVLRTLIISPSQRTNSPVIPPKEIRDNDIKDIRTNHLTPHRIGGSMKWRHACKTIDKLACPIRRSIGKIDRDQDRASQNTKDQEDIAAHFREPQKNDGIQANAVHQILLLGFEHGCYPGEIPLANRRRHMFLVGMFELGRVDNRVVGSE